MSVVTVESVRDRLDKTLTVDDGEIEDMIDAAEAEYERLIGPLSGTVTEKLDGGKASLILRSTSVGEITAAAYNDGTEIDLDDLDLDTRTGILHWGYNTAGVFTSGARNVTITYTVTAPLDHLERIRADVAGYFSASQRGGFGGRPDFDAVEETISYAPVELFPRIKALAASYPTVA